MINTVLSPRALFGADFGKNNALCRSVVLFIGLFRTDEENLVYLLRR
jgi:hypothetical protein